MKIYTKTGDEGHTSLLGGTRLPKYDLRIEAYGTVDELNAHIGHLADQDACNGHRLFLQDIQQDLFTLGSHFAADPHKQSVKLPSLRSEAIPSLEASIDEMEKTLPPLKNFVLPGGHPANSLAHICRTICRRAERRITELHATHPLDLNFLAYFNRLSDWLFVFSRFLSHQAQADEIPWTPRS